MACDADRLALLEAERSVRSIRAWIDNLDWAWFAREILGDHLGAIEVALRGKRAELGMQQRQLPEAA